MGGASWVVVCLGMCMTLSYDSSRTALNATVVGGNWALVQPHLFKNGH